MSTWIRPIQLFRSDVQLLSTGSLSELDALLPSMLDRAFRGEL